MFKKTLLAAALAASAFGANAALTVTTTSADISSQGLPLTKAYELASVEVTLSASELSALTDGSKLRLVFTGAFVASAPTGTTAYGDNSTTSTATPAFGAAVATSTTIVVPISTAPTSTGAQIAGDTITVNTIPLLLSSAAVGSKVNVTASILTSSDVEFTSTRSASTEAAEVVEQFKAVVTSGADAKIDVANARLTFESKAKTDTIVLTGTTTGTGATAVSATVTVKGDFTDDIASLSDGTNNYVINTAKSEAAYTYTTSSTPSVSTFLGGATTLTATVDGLDAIAPRAFTTSVGLSYTDAETAARTQALATDAASGSWTLNGDGGKISFLPFGSEFSQSVTITNTGKVDGEITVDWFSDGNTATTPLTAVATANSVTDISAELRAKAAAAGITGNAALNFVVNSPLGDIQIDALYYSKSDKDRGVVLTGGVNNAK